MQNWNVFYYKKVKYYFLVFVPCILATFAPSILININKDVFKQYEWMAEKATIWAVIIFFVGFIIIMIIKSIKHKTTLNYNGNDLKFLQKTIHLLNSNISFGRYGMPGAGSHGSVLFIQQEDQIFKIGILKYTALDSNLYTKDWTMKVDCFIDKKDIETLLSIVEKKQKIETIQSNAFNKDELVFELRRSMKIGKTILWMYAFIGIPIATLLIFNINNYFVTLLLVLAGMGGFIYFLLRYNKKGTGYYMTIQNGMLNFLDLKSRREIFSTSINTIKTKVYILELTSKLMTFYYLTIKLKIPGFKTITIGQTSEWGNNAWKDKNIKTKWFTLSTPNYIVDTDSWNRLANAFNIHI